jgi:hypothetical protein
MRMVVDKEPAWSGSAYVKSERKPLRAQGGTFMRMLLIAAIAAGTFIVTMAGGSNDAQAVVCARGIHRAGCVGVHGAVVVHRHHGAVCRRYGLVRGVRHCVLY